MVFLTDKINKKDNKNKIEIKKFLKRSGWIELRCPDCQEVLGVHPNRINDSKYEWVSNVYLPALIRNHKCKEVTK